MSQLQQQKIRIRLKSYDSTLLNISCEKIIDTASRTDSLTMGPIPIPTRRKIYCVLRSPHVNKDSREHFETRTHKRIIDVSDDTLHPEIRILLAKIYIKNKTPDHSFWALSQELLAA